MRIVDEILEARQAVMQARADLHRAQREEKDKLTQIVQPEFLDLVLDGIITINVNQRAMNKVRFPKGERKVRC